MRSALPLDTPEFQGLLHRLARDINDAAVFERLRANLNSSFKASWREFNQSNTF